MANINVLLISSESKSISLIKSIINIGADNFSLDISENCAAGLDRLAKYGIDVVIQDITASIEKGFDEFKKIKEAYKNMPVVILLSKEKEDYGFAAIDAGADSFLIKEELSLSLIANTMKYSMERRVLLLELEQYAKELLSSEEYFRNLIESNVDGMVVFDTQGIVKFVNSSAEAFFDKKLQDLAGKIFEYGSEPGKTKELSIKHKSGDVFTAEMRVVSIEWEREPAYLASLRDITDRKKAENEKIKLINDLQDAIKKIRTLSGLLPICAVCKKIRDDKGYWNQIEMYLEEHSKAEFSHGICPDCQKKVYRRVYDDKEKGKNAEKEM